MAERERRQTHGRSLVGGLGQNMSVGVRAYKGVGGGTPSGAEPLVSGSWAKPPEAGNLCSDVLIKGQIDLFRRLQK